MNCREALALMYEYLDGELTPDRLKKIKAHLSACEHCFSKFEFEEMLQHSISDKGQIEVDAEPLKRKVLQGIREMDTESEQEGFFFRYRPYLATAAVAILILFGFSFIFNGGQSELYAKVEPLVKTHKNCCIDLQRGARSVMTSDDIRTCLSELFDVSDVLLRKQPDRNATYGEVVTCHGCNVAHVVFRHGPNEVSIYVFGDKQYEPPSELDVRVSGPNSRECRCGSLDGMNVVYWQCMDHWWAAVSSENIESLMSFSSAY